MPLKVRFFECPDCGHQADRDLNASKNIERWFEGIFVPERSESAVSSIVSACGVDKPDSSHAVATVKQEINSLIAYVQLSLDLGNYG